MAKFKAVSQGTQIVLVAGPLVVLSLFFTWQHVEVDYGRAGIAIMSLDGWDVWGLLLAVLVIATVVIVAIRAFSETELSENVPWPTLTFVLGLSAFGVALLKNLTDPGSSWGSYGFVALAGAVAVGTSLDWLAARKPPAPLPVQRRRGLRSAA